MNSNLQRPGLAVPDHVAQQRNQEMILRDMILSIASQNLPHLLAISYRNSMMDAREERDRLGPTDGEGTPRELEFKMDILNPANIAIAGAKALLIQMGLLPKIEAEE